MAKRFREWVPEQITLLPASVLDWIGAGHLVHFVTALVKEQLDLAAILNSYDEARGYPPYDPQAKEISADAGYCSEHNLRELSRRQIRGYVASRWQKNNLAGSKDQNPPDKVDGYVRAMWRRLRQGAHRSRYRLRKQVVEPVFGQVKQVRGFRQFLLRGERKVAGEWNLLCTAHNLLKLAAVTG